MIDNFETKVTVDGPVVNEGERDHARSPVDTEPFEKSRHERKKVKMLFAHLERHLGFEWHRLGGLTGANDEFLLTATAQIPKRPTKIAANPPPPIPKAA